MNEFQLTWSNHSESKSDQSWVFSSGRGELSLPYKNSQTDQPEDYDNNYSMTVTVNLNSGKSAHTTLTVNGTSWSSSDTQFFSVKNESSNAPYEMTVTCFL